MDYQDEIISGIAEIACKRISSKVVRELQKMTEDLLSGDDSGLINIWDEVCVQVQAQHSIHWGIYLDVIESIIYEKLEKLDSMTKQAIWLQTADARSWQDECNENERGEIPAFLASEISYYILNKYILNAAANWTNKRIEEYIDRGYDW